MESYRASRLHASAINFLSNISLTGEYQRDPVLLRDASLNNTIIDPHPVQCYGQSIVAPTLPYDAQLDSSVSDAARSPSSETSHSERSGFLDFPFPIPIIGASRIKYISITFFEMKLLFYMNIYIYIYIYIYLHFQILSHLCKIFS